LYDINKNVLDQYQKYNVSKIRVEFSGSGDSGQIDCVDYFNDKGVEVSTDFVDTKVWDKEKREWGAPIPATHTLEPAGTKIINVYVPEESKEESTEESTLPKPPRMKRVEKEVEVSALEALEDYAYDKISDTGVDWYNNEGGHGEFTFTLNEAKEWSYTLDVSVYYTEESQEHASVGKVESA
jgi:hypothetical protein